MTLFSPLPRPPGLPPILTPNQNLNTLDTHPFSPPSNTVGPNPDVISQQSGTGISVSSGGSWIWFPLTSFKETNKQSLVKHMYPNQPNARVENTGFDPREWELIIPLTNNIFPTANEKWNHGSLYPGVYSKLKGVFEDGRSHVVQLPTEQVICKIEDWSYVTTGNSPRDGIIVTVHLTECIDDNLTIADTNSSISPYNVSSNCSQLEGQYINLVYFNPPGLNLQGLFNQISALIKQCSAYPNNIVASINSQSASLSSTVTGAVGTVIRSPAATYNQALTIYSQNKATVLGVNNQLSGGSNPIVNALRYDQQTVAVTTASYQTLTTTSSTGAAAFTAKAIIFIQSLISYYQSLKNIQTALMQQLLLTLLNHVQQINAQVQSGSNTNQYSVLSFISTNAITFVAVARLTNNSIDDIMSLNPNLAQLSVIPINSQIYYYSSTGA